MDKIMLTEIQVMACHGVNEREKREAQPFRISLTLDANTQAAGLSDDLEQTVDYGDLYIKVKKFAEMSSYNLIEALAENIAALILADQRIRRVEVAVTKLKAKKDGETFPASVLIQRGR